MRVLSNAELTQRLEKLEQSFFASRNREVSNTYMAENADSKVNAITPTTYIKTAYIGDTEVTFTDVQGTTGNLSVFFDNDNIGADYTVSRFVNSIVIGFLKPLEEVTQVTISIS